MVKGQGNYILHVQVTTDPKTVREFKRIIKARNYLNMADFFRDVIRDVVNGG